MKTTTATHHINNTRLTARPTRRVPLETTTRSLGRAADADAHTNIRSAGRIVTYNTICRWSHFDVVGRVGRVG